MPGCKKATLQAIIRGRVSPEAVIHSDGWRGYDGLADVGYAKHFRVNHGANEFARGARHVNGVEGSRSCAKSRLRQSHGSAPEKFYLHPKECEYRFNQRRGANSDKLCGGVCDIEPTRADRVGRPGAAGAVNERLANINLLAPA